MPNCIPLASGYTGRVAGVRKHRKGEQLSFADAGGVLKLPKKPRKRRRGVELGRRPRPERVGFVSHVARDLHDPRHPVHVSIRRVRGAPSLRSERIYRAIVGQLARAKSQGVRVVHHSVQHDHLHFIVEGEDRRDLSDQMRKLFSRIALAVNAIAMRRGSLFRDRHHRRELRTPTQTRNALVYVLFNERKHDFEGGGPISDETMSSLDDRTSIGWVHLWSERARPPPETLSRLRSRAIDGELGDSPVSEPRTWLARSGWAEMGGGPMELHELPRFW